MTTCGQQVCEAACLSLLPDAVWGGPAHSPLNVELPKLTPVRVGRETSGNESSEYAADHGKSSVRFLSFFCSLFL
jgi:hypothetical protein